MIFPSKAWIAALVAAVNRDPDLPRALSGLGEDLAAVVEAEPPGLRREMAAWGRHDGRRIVELRVLEDADEIWELEPAYVVRAPYGVWKKLLSGDDPVKAALSGRVRVEGDLDELVRRAHHRAIIDRALGSLDTRFADDAQDAGGSR